MLTKGTEDKDASEFAAALLLFMLASLVRTMQALVACHRRTPL